jgi:hypothetical protein
MTPIARFTTRGADDSNNQVDLIVGAAFKQQDGINGLKPDHVYEIREFLGELMIVDLGLGIVRQPKEAMKDKNLFLNWGSNFAHIVTSSAKTYLLTLKEMKELLTERDKN